MWHEVYFLYMNTPSNLGVFLVYYKWNEKQVKRGTNKSTSNQIKQTSRLDTSEYHPRISTTLQSGAHFIWFSPRICNTYMGPICCLIKQIEHTQRRATKFILNSFFFTECNYVRSLKVFVFQSCASCNCSTVNIFMLFVIS